MYLRDGSAEIKCISGMDLLRHTVYLRGGSVEIYSLSQGWIC